MKRAELIFALRDAKGPDRKLDVEIAKLVHQNRADSEAPIVWSDLVGYPEKIPRFTRSMKSAFALVSLVSPKKSGGCAWEPGAGSATIGDGPVEQAANPAIALCIAAIQFLK
ncbi:hypothetical protein KX729_01890 [Rhizobium sp. XQZ8]|uniref:hypothetical protein n=1 Tax=Rhizobium populisoli TaxID=2859785 RepID=UPI001CA4A967|nr:hypothetical protein [Rhizobium populisoli]MBW6420183.1 hypothetical protein [Rhizobium populisoli]